ncbi:uncharacterized protein [Fopius arisanus]|uniref:Uncharacterized protein n=1 Tax=Fopius arisanus TaxID=64838 RepID=A0A9R1TBV9_9HYME|nr:PREDICTED: uncharacterized protein LOC105268425 [Fopius arisanus]XP_011306286.1 PREDICTED: uncharacterized protein LOC105268425 [Fopius arisanus]
MAQGKLKVKTSTPGGKKNKGGSKKGSQVQRRNNAPIKPKKAKFEETHKLKQMITRTVNRAMENELRDKALDGKKSLTKKESKPSTSQKS